MCGHTEDIPDLQLSDVPGSVVPGTMTTFVQHAIIQGLGFLGVVGEGAGRVRQTEIVLIGVAALVMIITPRPAMSIAISNASVLGKEGKRK